MTQAGGDVKEEVWRAFIVLLTNAPELHAYAARSLFRSLRDNLASAEISLLATATWYIGKCTTVFLVVMNLLLVTQIGPRSPASHKCTTVFLVVMNLLLVTQIGPRSPASAANRDHRLIKGFIATSK